MKKKVPDCYLLQEQSDAYKKKTRDTPPLHGVLHAVMAKEFHFNNFFSKHLRFLLLRMI